VYVISGQVAVHGSSSIYLLCHYIIRARIPLRGDMLDTTICGKVYQGLAEGRRLSPGIPVFLHQQNRPPRYNRNIVESGVKHHKPNQTWLIYVKEDCTFDSSFQSVVKYIRTITYLSHIEFVLCNCYFIIHYK
jgi:hypothetical protein